MVNLMLEQGMRGLPGLLHVWVSSIRPECSELWTAAGGVSPATLLQPSHALPVWLIVESCVLTSAMQTACSMHAVSICSLAGHMA